MKNWINTANKGGLLLIYANQYAKDTYYYLHLTYLVCKPR